MFKPSALYYDKLYSHKNYSAETTLLLRIIQKYLRSGGNRLLDLACGTGRHIELLKPTFECEGLDNCAELLDLASQRNPGIPFHLGDMSQFHLPMRFDVITCLFSSIGYLKTLDKITQAAVCMTQHLRPGGLILIEPWFTPERWIPGKVHALFIDEPDLKISRINTSKAEGRLSYFDLHYLVGTPLETQHFLEHHELGLFTQEEMSAALVSAGLEVIYDSEGLTDRGLYIGIGK